MNIVSAALRKDITFFTFLIMVTKVALEDSECAMLIDAYAKFY